MTSPSSSSQFNTQLWERLQPNQRSGSKARCHLFTHGSRAEVAGRLSLITGWGQVAPTDTWMPAGFDAVEETQLASAQFLLPEASRQALLDWWLVASLNANTPNWDIASTCSIEGRPGLLLIEAKAHDEELLGEAKGKPLKAETSSNSRLNHARIGECIHEASVSLAQDTGLPWSLSRDNCYQMSNRFSWSWKLATLGIPVILVYLGFLNAEEMRRSTQSPFSSHSEWEQLVMGHSQSLFPAQVWESQWSVAEQPFIPLIRSYDQAYNQPLRDTRLPTAL